MPFFQPFKAKFDDGDLIYGLTPERKIFAEKNFNALNIPTLPVTIDQYAVTKLEDILQKHPEIKVYKPVPQDQDLFRHAIQAHPKYRSILEAGGSIKNGFTVHPPKAMTRKCKAGLFWITEKNSGRHIHFLLDNINMECVVNKNHKSDLTGRSITGAELRWIYRNKNNPNVINKIQFWHKGIPVLPPWITSPCLWHEYNRRNAINVEHPHPLRKTCSIV